MPMTAGFPRPRKFVEKVKIKGQGAWKNHDWSKWDNKEYPIPFSARMDSVGKIAVSRVQKCKSGRLCIVCGVKVKDENPWAYCWGNTFPSDAGPFHEKCVTLTKTMCPVVAESSGEFRFVQVDWESLEARLVPDYLWR